MIQTSSCLVHQIQLHTKHAIQNFVEWCNKHFLILNVKKDNKKKERQTYSTPKSIGDGSPVVVQEQSIAQVDSYGYLGVHVDYKLTWSVQVENVRSLVQQRATLFFSAG